MMKKLYRDVVLVLVSLTLGVSMGWYLHQSQNLPKPPLIETKEDLVPPPGYLPVKSRYQYDVVQIVFTDDAQLLSISGFRREFAGKEMRLVTDLKGDGQDKEDIGPPVTADKNGAFLMIPEPQPYKCKAGSAVFVQYRSESTDFVPAEGVVVSYLDRNDKKMSINLTSFNVRKEGQIIIIDPHLKP